RSGRNGYVGEPCSQSSSTSRHSWPPFTKMGTHGVVQTSSAFELAGMLAGAEVPMKLTGGMPRDGVAHQNRATTLVAGWLPFWTSTLTVTLVPAVTRSHASWGENRM